MRIGTKSILFGVHQFVLHPLLVALAWWRLYGFPWDPRLWVAFVVHDLGYWGKPNMDGPEGEDHVVLGARIMSRLFGHRWGELCYYHSRFRAGQHGVDPSRLCFADKLVFVIEPWWMYLPRARLSGELREYLDLARRGDRTKYTSQEIDTTSGRTWHRDVQAFSREWVRRHR